MKPTTLRISTIALAFSTAIMLRAQGPSAPAQGPGPGVPPAAGPENPGRGRGGPGDQAGAPAGGQGRGGAVAGRGGLGDAGIGTTFTPDFTPQPPVEVKTPDEQLKHFILKPGYKMELVVADPVIDEPAAVAFDGNGRMFVLELRGYMQDVAATGTRDPIGRISLHEDVNNDGVYEKHSVFVDNLIFPRFVTPFGPNAILTMETDHDEVWKFTDTNNDGVADKKELFTTGFGRSGNVEHQTGFLTWTMDNWMYSTTNNFRVRWTPNGVLREPAGSNGSHWGVTQDDDGKQWFQASATGLPGYFQFPIAYGNFAFPEQYLPSQPDFLIAWGAPVRVADMQGGVNVVRMPDGSANSMTGAAGNDVVRGHRMPDDLRGNYLYDEPVARIIRRNKVTNLEGLTQLQNAHLYDEFVKSTDPLFRPVDVATAPDGTLYVVDMYRGIIQEAGFLGGPTSYVRQRISQYQLDKIHSHGRIWRLSYEPLGGRDRTQPRMNTQTPAQLVANLSHANGWWRDTAQQLLVLKQDKSVVPALQRLVRQRDNLLARFHALWTLEGLGALDLGLAREVLKDAAPRMRIQAIRASETLYKSGFKELAADYAAASRDADVNVVIQSLLTMNTLKTTESAAATKTALDTNKARGVQLVANAILNPNAAGRGGRGGGPGGGGPTLSANEQASFTRGQEIYSGLCFTCHGEDGFGTPRPNAAPGATMAPALGSNPRITGHRDYALAVVLHGLQGPVAGTNFPEVMIPMGSNSDQWVADVTTYIRNAFGNSASAVRPEDVARLRSTAGTRTAPWTFAELDPRVPKVLGASGWKTSASHNSTTAAGALSFANWSSGAQQAADMWFQIELPAAATLAEVQWNAGVPAGLAGPGGGGRGGAAGRGGAGGPGGPGGPGAGAPGAAPAAGAAPAPPAAPATPPPPPQPRTYRVETSNDGAGWTTVATVQGTTGLNAASFSQPTSARFVRIVQVGTPADANPWTMTNLKLFAVEGTR